MMSALFPLLSLLLLAALAGPVGAAPATIVVFGDSTTAEDATLSVYRRRLEQVLHARSPGAVRVVNAGVRGNTTAMAAQRFASDVLAAAPDLVVIQFGINDATFIAALQERGVRVVLMTPNPLSWTPRLVELYGHPPYDPRDPEGLNINLTRYAAAMRELAAGAKVPLVDVWAAHAAARRAQMEPLLADGMHPNAQGHALVARLLEETIVGQRLVALPPAR